MVILSQSGRARQSTYFADFLLVITLNQQSNLNPHVASVTGTDPITKPRQVRVDGPKMAIDIPPYQNVNIVRRRDLTFPKSIAQGASG